ncbi:MAG: hypothetical protein IKW30_04240, partial [Lachnospiraceae bacterium]|nr:hypothetical protein [Lachnospiraceae bacterium]
NSSAFGFLLHAAPGFKVAFSEPGAAFSVFTFSHMTNQQSDWSWLNCYELSHYDIFLTFSY